MRYLLSPSGQEALYALLRQRPLLAFDFDGTLAPIVPLPDDAHASTAVATAMSRLSQLAPVAVVTGRAVADVRSRLGFVPGYIVGNHGAEGLTEEAGDWARSIERQVAQWHMQIETWRLPPGVLVEDKRRSITLHYRLASDRGAAQALLGDLARTLNPVPQIIGGKCVVNLLPAEAPNKYDAVVELARRAEAGSVMFLGDDDTDEIVFRHAHPGWLTCRIERREDSAARFYLNAQSEVAGLIQFIERAMR
ncbi:trehalose-phosphatase [Uliginosibacterium sp. sgz301328]|uniref:trehalose-phosphatase n=1 Tax=Uliginosibacterium sp. sgz301328 TaxID=3243764 RepID=UPI00359CBFE4